MNKPSKPARKQFTEAEEQLLHDLIQEHGVKNWGLITQKFNQAAQSTSIKTAKDCREKWKNHLNPKISKSYWTYEEEI